jgi:hypothetical protein
MQAPVKKIATLFYGSFIRPDVMRQAGFEPESIEVAKLSGYDICFDPHANIFPADQNSIFGILAYPTHADLDKLYRRDGVGLFLPEAVMVETKNNRFLPTLCFIPPKRNDTLPDLAYVDLIINAGRQHGFPEWYLKRLGMFG